MHVPAALHALEGKGFSLEMFAVEWFQTLFVCGLHPAAALCGIDLILSGIDNVPLRIACAVVEVMRPRIISMSAEDLMLVSPLPPHPHPCLRAM